jgi:4-carboxymuconolactone decarboxylase
VEYKERLRRLTVHDSAFVDSLTGPNPSNNGALDGRTAALVRVAATIATDAATASFQEAVAIGLSAGATREEIVATLEAVTPVTGIPRVVSSAPKIALALGYDVEEALEELEP